MSRYAVVALCVLALLGAGSLTAHASTPYALTASPGVDTPQQTVHFESQAYTFSSVGRVDPGGAVSASVTGPVGESTQVLLYDSNRNIVDFKRATNGDTVTFKTSDSSGDYDPGSYMLVLSHDGVHEAVEPLVLSAYHVRVDAPSAGTQGGSVDVTASLSPVAGTEAVDSVVVAIGDDARDRRVTLQHDGGTTYRGSVDLGDLPAGDYQLYVLVRGPTEVFGSKELIAVSDPQPFAVTGQTTTTAPAPSGGGGGAPAAPSTTATATATATATPTPTPTDTPMDTVTPTETATTAAPPTTTAAPATTTEPSTTREAITPAQTTATPEQSAAGFDWRYLLLPIVAILVVVWWVRR